MQTPVKSDNDSRPAGPPAQLAGGVAREATDAPFHAFTTGSFQRRQVPRGGVATAAVRARIVVKVSEI